MSISAPSVRKFACGIRFWAELAGQIRHEIFSRIKRSCVRRLHQWRDSFLCRIPGGSGWTDLFTISFSYFSMQKWSAGLSLLICLLGVRTLGIEYVFAQQTPKQTAAGFKVADGLEVTLWASEPNLVNPTNIDVDSKGRVWVCEAVNYRLTRGGQKAKDLRPAGDRIVILEDTDGDGRADKSKTFVQDPSLRSPLGIAVLGNKVIVSQSPDLIVYTKDDQDNILKKEILLTGWRGIDSDHGLHAIVFGPDGRLYFNNGDPGLDVMDKSGRRILSSRAGPYFAGTALRMNPGGSDLAVIGHNFRNPYELALDSFGNVWQTDNDDDGNAWVRLNYVIEGGNFGYWGPGGRSWEVDKGTHFHAELPGVIPNVLRMGAGAPAGLIVYEGRLLPERYRGNLIHAEAGARQINTYQLLPEGAGYTSNAKILVGSDDTWFRPSDVCVGPDGAVFISDWSDPGVGGHRMVDTTRGRIYRLSPFGYKTRKVSVDIDTAAGLEDAFASPAQSVRYLAFMKFKEQGPAALSVLQKVAGGGDPILRARALWLLGGIPGEGEASLRASLDDPDPHFRVLALRVMQLYHLDLQGAIRKLINDPSLQVRREIALVLSHLPAEESLDWIVELCRGFDGKDRWLLESLGIAGRGKEELLYPKLTTMYAGQWNSQLAELLWEFRPTSALPDMVSILKDPNLPLKQRLEALRVLSYISKPEAGIAVAEFITSNDQPAELMEKAFQRLNQQLYSEWFDLRKNPAVIAAIQKALVLGPLQSLALELIGDLEDPQFAAELSKLTKSPEIPEEVRGAALMALGRTRNQHYEAELLQISHTASIPLRVIAVRALGYLKPEDLEPQLKRLLLSQAPNEVRAECVRVLGHTDSGNTMLLNLEESQSLPSELKTLASAVTNASSNPAIKARAQKLLPQVTSKNRRPLPPAKDLLARQGDAERGRKVFSAVAGPKCKSCHSLEESKKGLGPNLSSIGTKLGKQALLDSILNPSAGIAPEYYVWNFKTKTEGDIQGIIVEDTPQRVTVRTDATTEFRFKPSDITARRRSYLSLMPEDLPGTMTDKELVDLLEFLTTLKASKQSIEVH